MQTLPNQESLLQNQVFLAAQYSSTYLRFPYPPAGEGRVGGAAGETPALPGEGREGAAAVDPL